MKTLHGQYKHVWKPAQPGAPVLVLLHGMEGDERRMLSLGRRLARGWHHLSIRGNVSEGRYVRYFRRHAEGVFDEEDIRGRADDLASFLEEAGRHYGFANRELTVLGYSNGANMAASMALVRPDAFQRGVLLRPMMPFDVAQVPGLEGKEYLILAGKEDRICPPDRARRLAETLAEGGAVVELEWQEAGHDLVPADYRRGREWLQARNTG